MPKNGIVRRQSKRDSSLDVIRINETGSSPQWPLPLLNTEIVHAASQQHGQVRDASLGIAEHILDHP